MELDKAKRSLVAAAWPIAIQSRCSSRSDKVLFITIESAMRRVFGGIKDISATDHPTSSIWSGDPVDPTWCRWSATSWGSEPGRWEWASPWVQMKSIRASPIRRRKMIFDLRR